MRDLHNGSGVPIWRLEGNHFVYLHVQGYETLEPRMHIVIGLIAGITLGALAGSAAVQFVSPAALTVQANKAPAPETPTVRYWDI